MSRKKCCCNAQPPTSGCDCCPQPFENDPPFTMPAWEVTISSGGQRNCAAGSGAIKLFGSTDQYAFCLCGSCGIQELEPTNLRYSEHELGQVNCDPPDGYDPPCTYELATCDVCLPEGGTVDPAFPGGIATLRTYGCRDLPPDVPLTLCGAPAIGIDPGNANGCTCCNTETCDGDENQPYYGYDDIPDGVSYVSPLYRCRIRPDTCCPMLGANPHPKDTRVWTMIAVEFYAPGYVKKEKFYFCNNNTLGWDCMDLPDTISPTGQIWYCVYARPQEACEWYAEGSYRLVYVSTSGCVSTAREDGGEDGTNCYCSGYCNLSSPTVLCDWDGVQLGKLQSTWQPPSSITVTRIQ